MILWSTLRRLAAQGATVFRVDFPALVCVPTHCTPARVEVFSTLRQASQQAYTFNVLARTLGKPEPKAVVVGMKASAALADPRIVNALDKFADVPDPTDVEEMRAEAARKAIPNGAWDPEAHASLAERKAMAANDEFGGGR